MDYKKTAADVLKLVGGEKNVASVTHCITRLRFNLVDESKADSAAIQKIKGVMGTASQGGQYQVIIGSEVGKVYEEVIKLGKFKASEPVKQQKKGKVAEVCDSLAGIFTPVIPAMIGCAMIKAVLVILKALNLIDISGQLYSILTFVSDSAYYFLPMLLAWSAAVKFKCNVGFALALAGVILHPNFTAMMAAGEPIKFLGLPVTTVSYGSSVLPIILAVWVMSYVEKFADKVSPKVVKAILKPLLVVLIMAPLTLVVIGPLGTIAGNYLAGGINFIQEHASWLVSGIIGGIFPFLIMTGMHYCLGPACIAAYTATGMDGLTGPGMLVHSFTQSGAAFAVALKTKNKDIRQIAISAGTTAALGVTEPAMFGVNLRFRKPLIAVVIGGVVGGIYVGAFGVVRIALGITGLATLPAFITENPMNLVHAIIGCIIGFLVSFVLTLVLGFEDEPEEEEEATVVEKATAKKLSGSQVVVSPMAGEVVALETVNDAAFSNGCMGKGIAVKPSEGKLNAPINGKVTAIFPTKHAVGITSDNGIEVLMHIGMDTVQLEGKYFTSMVKEGDVVKAGDLLISFDMDKIAAEGYDLITPVVITNTDDFSDIVATEKKKANFGDVLLTVLA